MNLVIFTTHDVKMVEILYTRKIYLYGCDGIDKIESFEDTYHKDIIKYHSTVFKKESFNIFKDQLVLNERVNKKDLNSLYILGFSIAYLYFFSNSFV